MKIQNPKVTVEDDARTKVKETNGNGFLDWLFMGVVTGDDGELYELGGSILSMPNIMVRTNVISLIISIIGSMVSVFGVCMSLYGIKRRRNFR